MEMVQSKEDMLSRLEQITWPDERRDGREPVYVYYKPPYGPLQKLRVFDMVSLSKDKTCIEFKCGGKVVAVEKRELLAGIGRNEAKLRGIALK